MGSREIVNIQVGQAGNQVGEAFWTALLEEHAIDFAGKWIGDNDLLLERAGVYFSEVNGAGNTRYVPRSLQIDLETGVCDRLKGSPIGGLFRPDSYICGEPGAGNNWAKGYYTEGAEHLDAILTNVRSATEPCDCLQGFQVIHSLGGGTGSGLGSLLLEKLREEYPDKMLASFSIFPSPKVSETVVEPYNSILSVHQLLESTDLSVCVDNEALYEICARSLKLSAPSFKDLNGLIAKVMCGVSTSLRFPGQLNGDLRKLAMNLIPFPRLHFLMPSYTPLHSSQSAAYQKGSVPELVQALFDRQNLLAACDPRNGRYLAAATIFRGNIASSDAEEAVQELQTRNSQHFVEWIPNNISVSLVSVPPPGLKQAAVALANSTAIQDVFQRNLETFAAMFKRGAFLHWYIGEGMDIMEFQEAESNTRDLIAEYQQYQEATSNDAEEAEYLEEDE